MKAKLDRWLNDLWTNGATRCRSEWRSIRFISRIYMYKYNKNLNNIYKHTYIHTYIHCINMWIQDVTRIGRIESKMQIYIYVIFQFLWGKVSWNEMIGNEWGHKNHQSSASTWPMHTWHFNSWTGFDLSNPPIQAIKANDCWHIVEKHFSRNDS